LKIDTESLEDHQVKITVEVDTKQLEDAKRRAARHLAKRMKIPGFRPGKAPYHVVVRYAGEGPIIEEGLELLVQDIYPEIIKEANIDSYGPGTLNNVVSLDPPTLEFVIPLEAEVELGDYRLIRRLYEPKDVTDDDIDVVIGNLREQQAVIEPVDREVRDGDVVNVRLSGTYSEVEDEDGHDPDFLTERSMPILVNPDDDDEWPFAGFSRNLVGMKPGEEKTITHVPIEDPVTDGEPEIDTHDSAAVDYKYVIEDVKSRTLPELDDEFAASIGEYENLDELHEYIKSTLEQQNLSVYNESYDEAVLDEAIEQSTIKFPPQMLDNQINIVINNLESNLGHQQLDLDLYLKSRDMNIDELREEAKPVAEDRLRRTLFLMELAQAERIEVQPEEIETETSLTIDNITRNQEKEKEELTKEDMSNIVGNVFTTILVRRAMERLHDISSGKLDETQEDESDIDNETETASDDDKEETVVSEPEDEAEK
jgi:trigger factor